MNREIKVFRLSSGGFVREAISNKDATVKPSGQIAVYGQMQLHDAILFVVNCSKHQSILLKEIKKGVYYMPFFPLKIGKWAPLLLTSFDILCYLSYVWS